MHDKQPGSAGQSGPNCNNTEMVITHPRQTSQHLLQSMEVLVKMGHGVTFVETAGLSAQTQRDSYSHRTHLKCFFGGYFLELSQTQKELPLYRPI